MTEPASYDPATLDFYAREAPVYAAAGRTVASRWLGAVLEHLPAGARILDLGCGCGHEAAAMLASGFDVEPTDGSAAMAAEAERLLGRPVRVMRFDQLSESAAYDAVWANASLLHVPCAALADVLARVLRALKPGGVHFASYKGGGVAGRDGLGRYYNYPDRAALLDAYTRSGSWEILSVEERAGSGYDGVTTPWIRVTMRRPDGKPHK